MNKQTNYLRKLLPAALLITAVAPANAFCPVNFFPDPLFRPSFVSSQASIDAALTAFNARTRVSIQKNSDVVTAAIGVLTAQKALAASQIGKAIENNTQVQAQAQQHVDQDQRGDVDRTARAEERPDQRRDDQAEDDPALGRR